MKKPLSSVSAILLCLSHSAWAVTWFVATGGNDNNDGTNGWAQAFATISNAVARAVSNDVVLVSNGLFVVTDQIHITNAIRVQSLNGRDYTAVERSGTVTCRIFRVNHALAVVDGFTITNGLLSGADGGAGVWLQAGSVLNCDVNGNVVERDGAGIYMQGGFVSNCMVRNNSSATYQRYGGGMWIAGGTAQCCTITRNGALQYFYGAGVYMTGGLLADSEILTNYVTYGAVWLVGGGATISNCTIRGNTSNHYAPVYLATGNMAYKCTITDNSGAWGGGIYSANSSTLIHGCKIMRNYCNFGGAGIILRNGGIVENCLIISNRNASTTNPGGGIWLQPGYMGQVRNSTICHNVSVNTSGGGISWEGSGGVSNCIIYFNSAPTFPDVHAANPDQFGYSCSPALVGGVSNITANPLFVAPEEYDYRLQKRSPCIEKGTTNVAYHSDIEGVAHFDADHDGIIRPDMGCHEFPDYILPHGSRITAR